jgi:hypothetical protein
MSTRIVSRVAPAGPLATSVPDEAGYRRYVKNLLISLLLGLALLAALNFVVNPLGFYSARLIRPLTWSTRDVKVDLMAGAARPPGVLILGSSRTMLVRPRDVQALTGEATLNISVDAARAEDLWALYQYAVTVRGWTPREILFGLDLETFHNHQATDDRLIGSSQLRPLLPDQIRREGRWRRMGALLSGDQTTASLTALLYTFTAFPAEGHAFAPDGLLQYEAWDSQIRSGRFQANIAGSVPEYHARFRDYTAVDQTRWALFEKLVEDTARRGTTVRSFLSPLHPNVIAELRVRTAFDRVRGQADQRLQALASRIPSFHYRDLTDIASFDGRADLFYDGGHMRPENAALLARAVYGR